jgi:hypothetical protein
MLHMTSNPDSYPLSDVCLLLRAHAEQGWLSHELVPVLRQFEQRDLLPEEQLGAALAYLEVLWLEASERAAETEAAFAELDSIHISPNPSPSLSREARDYHDAVSALRKSVERHVARILARSAPSVPGCGPARNGGPLTHLDASL